MLLPWQCPLNKKKRLGFLWSYYGDHEWKCKKIYNIEKLDVLYKVVYECEICGDSSLEDKSYSEMIQSGFKPEEIKFKEGR